MNEWYTRQEVADILGVSKATVYQFAKQGKIVKIPDPHRLRREVRYLRAEVDALAEERKKFKPSGMKPAELAAKLHIPVSRIYNIIKENNLPVDEYPLGDEMIGYSISDELAERITTEVQRTLPTRATPTEFYNARLDIALYQRFKTPDGQDIRLVRNEHSEWGFYLQSRAWIPIKEGLSRNYVAAYPIHQKNITPQGYADLKLPKDQNETFDFLDFLYQSWGVENVRVRELSDYLALSVKSGTRTVTTPPPPSITNQSIQKFIVSGTIEWNEYEWNIISGYRRTSIELPEELLNEIQEISKDQGIFISDFIEDAILSKLKEMKENGHRL